MSKFLQGTVILIAAGFITKILGFINRIVVARMIGDEGVGLYMMAVPTLVLAITATQIGLPVAISKLVAEAEAAGDRQRVKQILVVSLATTGALSIVLLPALIAAAPWLSRTMFTDPRTYYPLLAIAPIVPIVAISSVLRGYFQGRQQMKPYAYSLLMEQIVRISLIALCTQPLLPYGVEYAAAGAMASSVLGELAALLYLLFLFKVKNRFACGQSFSLRPSRQRDVRPPHAHCLADDRRPFDRLAFWFLSQSSSPTAWHWPASPPPLPRGNTDSLSATRCRC